MEELAILLFNLQLVVDILYKNDSFIKLTLLKLTHVELRQKSVCIQNGLKWWYGVKRRY